MEMFRNCLCCVFAQCIIREENGKLIGEADKFTSVREIRGDEMTEVSKQQNSFFLKNIYLKVKSSFCASSFSDHHFWFSNVHQQKQTGLKSFWKSSPEVPYAKIIIFVDEMFN